MMPQDPDNYPSRPASTASPSTGGADSELSAAQKALKVAEDNLINARARYQNAAVQRDEAVSGQYTSSDVLVQDAVIASFNEAQAALAKAEDQYALAHRALATTFANIAARAETPAQAAERNAQAKYHAAQSALAYAQAHALAAKTPQEAAQAQAELLRAQAETQRVQGEITVLLPAQAQNLAAQAEEARARITQLFPAQAAQAQAGAQLTGAQAAQQAAETQQLLPAQVRNTLAQAGYTEAQIRQVEQNLARPAQVTQGLSDPTLVFQDPRTGLVSGQPNPAYQAANTRLLQNQYDSIGQIQGMIERRQMSPQEGQVYMDAIRRQTNAILAGTTPFQQEQEMARNKEAQANIGRDILNNRLAQGGQLASSLIGGMMQGAGRMTRPMSFEGFNPMVLVQGMLNEFGGGQATADMAASLIQGLQGGAQGGAPALSPVLPDMQMGMGIQGAQPAQAAQPAAPASLMPVPITQIDPRYQRRF